MRRLQAGSRTGLVPYFPVGFPRADSTLALVEAAVAAGADAIELGVPFSDPLADGTTIQRAANEALGHGVTLGSCLDAVREIRARGITIPLLFMGYYNPIHHYGVARFAADAAEAGIDGCIVPDLPPEEAATLREALDAHQLDLVPMVAPTSTETRLALATRDGRGFVYCVSLTGVTGARRELPIDLGAFLARVRSLTDLPLAVGFGISTREHVRQVGQLADIAVIGSAVVEHIEGRDTEQAAASLRAYLQELRGQGVTA